MTRLLLPALIVAALAACTTPMHDGGPLPPEPVASCNASRGNWAIGQAPTEDVLRRLQADTGSAALRVLRPGTVVTMDYRGDRLNVDVNERNAITGLRCG